MSGKIGKRIIKTALLTFSLVCISVALASAATEDVYHTSAYSTLMQRHEASASTSIGDIAKELQDSLDAVNEGVKTAADGAVTTAETEENTEENYDIEFYDYYSVNGGKKKLIDFNGGSIKSAGRGKVYTLSTVPCYYDDDDKKHTASTDKYTFKWYKVSWTSKGEKKTLIKNATKSSYSLKKDWLGFEVRCDVYNDEGDWIHTLDLSVMGEPTLKVKSYVNGKKHKSLHLYYKKGEKINLKVAATSTYPKKKKITYTWERNDRNGDYYSWYTVKGAKKATYSFTKKKKTEYIECQVWDGCCLMCVDYIIHTKKGTVTKKKTTKKAAPKKVTMHFKGNSGKASKSSKTVKKGSAIGTLPSASRTGYSFVGWYTGKSGGSKISSKTKVKANKTVYAHWKAHKYKVSFSANGGTGSMSSVSISYNQKKTLPKNTYKRKGYDFKGWNLKANGSGKSFKDKAQVKNLSSKNGVNFKLYAQWTVREYSQTQCKKSIAVLPGEKKDIGAKVYSTKKNVVETLSKNITWESSDPSVARVESSPFVNPFPWRDSSAGKLFYWTEADVNVVGVSEGTATVTGTLSDGTTMSTKVIVGAPDLPGRTSGNGGSMTVGENAKGSAGNRDTYKFLPGDYSLSSCMVPVDVSTTENEDGSYDIKVGIGLGRADLLDDDTKWNRLTKAVDDAQKGFSTYRESKILQEAAGPGSTIVRTKGWDGSLMPKFSIIGYASCTQDKNGNIINPKGTITGDFKWSGSTSWNFVTPIGPMFINLSASGDIAITGNAEWKNKKVELTDGSITLTPGIALTGGYGIDKVASIGAEGYAKIPIQILPASKGSFTAGANVKVHCMFIANGEWNLAEATSVMWDTTEGSSKKSAAPQITTKNLRMSSMKNVDSDAAWHGKVKKSSKVSMQRKTLQENALSSTIPMMQEIDGKKVMVWQAYDDSRSKANSVVLKYSVLENNVWSEPKAVLDDGYGDSFADLKVVDGKLCLAWQKVVKNVDSSNMDEMLTQMGTKSEIYFAEFDASKNVFANATRVTTNRECDMMPKIVANGKTPQITFVRNSENDLLQLTGENSILCYDVATKSTETVATAPGTIDKYVPYVDEGKVVATYVTNSNNTIAVINSQGGNINAFDGLLQNASEGTVSALTYEEGKLHMISEGKLYVYDLKTKAMKSYLAGESGFDATAVYCSNGDKAGYVWSSYDYETKIGQIKASMKTEDGFSEPIVLDETTGEVARVVAPVLEKDGTWKLAINQEDMRSDAHNLCFLTKDETQESTLVSAEILEDDQQKNLTGVEYVYKNEGDAPIESVKVSVKDSEGNVAEKKLSMHVEPGEVVNDTAYLNLDKMDAGQKVSITMVGNEERADSNNRVKDTYEMTDVALTGTATENGDEVEIEATLQNNGVNAAETAITLYKDAEMSTKLFEQASITVEKDTPSVVRFTIPKSDIKYDENGAAYLTMKADVEGGDYMESNNTIYLIAYKGETIAADTNPIQ